MGCLSKNLVLHYTFGQHRMMRTCKIACALKDRLCRPQPTFTQGSRIGVAVPKGGVLMLVANFALIIPLADLDRPARAPRKRTEGILAPPFASLFAVF